MLRPITSAYATASLIDTVMRDATLTNRVRFLTEPTATSIQDWTNIAEIRSRREAILDCLGQVLESVRTLQKPT